MSTVSLSVVNRFCSHDPACCIVFWHRIAQEAITNGLKHGRAKFINLSLEKTGEGVTLTITDDGIGLPEKPLPGGGMGLRIMAYRAGMIDATFKIERLPESGTRVTCKLPASRFEAVENHVPKN